MIYIFIFRSGTEEDFNELQQLLEDIYTFRRDQEELKQREKEKKKEKRRKRNRKKKMNIRRL